MDPSIVVALIAAPAALLTAAAVLIAARSEKTHANAIAREASSERLMLQRETGSRLSEIHVLVNDRLERALSRLAELEQRATGGPA